MSARHEARHDFRVATPAHLDSKVPINDSAGRLIARQVLAQLKSSSLEAFFLLIVLELLSHFEVIRNILIEVDELALDDRRLFSPVRGDRDKSNISSPVPGEEYRLPHAIHCAVERIGARLTRRIALNHVAPDNEIDACERREQIEELSPLHMREEYHVVAGLPQLIEHCAPLGGRVAKLESLDISRFLAEQRENAHLRAAYLLRHRGREETFVALIEICADEGKPRLRIRFQGAQSETELTFADRHRVVSHLDHGLRKKPAPVHLESAGLRAEVAGAEQEQPGIESSFLSDHGGPPGHATHRGIPSADGSDEVALIAGEQNREARLLVAAARGERDRDRYESEKSYSH